MFQKGPEAGSDNHVGILCGKTDAGDWIAVHCSSGKNGVTVGGSIQCKLPLHPPAILLPDTGTGSGNAEQQYGKHNNR